MNEKFMAICDICGSEVEEDEINEVDIEGDWLGASACNECYAELYNGAKDE